MVFLLGILWDVRIYCVHIGVLNTSCFWWSKMINRLVFHANVFACYNIFLNGKLPVRICVRRLQAVPSCHIGYLPTRQYWVSCLRQAVPAVPAVWKIMASVPATGLVALPMAYYCSSTVVLPSLWLLPQYYGSTMYTIVYIAYALKSPSWGAPFKPMAEPTENLHIVARLEPGPGSIPISP